MLLALYLEGDLDAPDKTLGLSHRRYLATERTSSEAMTTPERTIGDFHVFEHNVDTVTSFGAHRHREHQIAWMRQGRMQIDVDNRRLHLHPEHMIWLPSYLVHEMTIMTAGALVSAYIHPGLSPGGQRWQRPVVVTAHPLATELLTYLTGSAVRDEHREQCVQTLFGLLERAPERKDILALPHDRRARAIAAAILDNPADNRTLQQWAHETGVSTKTLMRAFSAETGHSYTQWRTRARMHSTLEALAAGQAVATIAASTGYSTTSGFIAAFRSVFDTTPSAYARTHRQ